VLRKHGNPSHHCNEYAQDTEEAIVRLVVPVEIYWPRRQKFLSHDPEKREAELPNDKNFLNLSK
jgi:hypothetical protein